MFDISSINDITTLDVLNSVPIHYKTTWGKTIIILKIIAFHIITIKNFSVEKKNQYKILFYLTVVR